MRRLLVPLNSPSGLVGSIIACFILVGCTESTTEPQASVVPESNEYRLADRPDDAMSLTDAMDELTENQDSEEKQDEKPAESVSSELPAAELTLIGRIDAGDFDPFEKERAAFLISELPPEGHGADDPDHADNCPFCKRRAEKAPKALVEIVDASGTPLPNAANTLLGVSKGDRVVAKGEVSYDSTVNMLKMRTSSVYVIP